jgi:hypothetical protein
MPKTTEHKAMLVGGPFDKNTVGLTVPQDAPPPPDFMVKVTPWNSNEILGTAHYKLLSKRPLRYEFVPEN